MEDPRYEIASMRLFAGFSLDNAIPDHAAIMNFRHLLKRHGLARKIFEVLFAWLSEAGVLVKNGIWVDATIIQAPNSIKNQSSEHDPGMDKTKKGDHWHFGMKPQIGVNAKTGLTQSVTANAADEDDLNQAHYLFHGKEEYVFADAGYRGAEKRPFLIRLRVLTSTLLNRPAIHSRINKAKLSV